MTQETENGKKATGRETVPVRDPHEGGPPPFGGSWERLYMIVLGELALLVALFYWFTKVFE